MAEEENKSESEEVVKYFGHESSVDYLGVDIGPCRWVQTEGPSDEVVTITRLYHYFKSVRSTLNTLQQQLSRAERKINYKFKVQLVDKLKDFYKNLFKEMRTLDAVQNTPQNAPENAQGYSNWTQRMKSDLFKQAQNYHYTTEENIDIPASEMYTNTVIEYEMQLDAVLEQLHASKKTIFDQEEQIRNLEDKITVLNERISGLKLQISSLEQDRDRVENTNHAIIENQRKRIENLKRALEELETERKADIHRFDAQKKSIVAEYDRRIEFMNATHATQLSDLENKLVTMYEAKIADISENHDEVVAKSKHFEGKVKKLESTIQSQRLMHTSVVDNLNSIIDDLKKKNSSAESDDQFGFDLGFNVGNSRSNSARTKPKKKDNQFGIQNAMQRLEEKSNRKPKHFRPKKPPKIVKPVAGLDSPNTSRPTSSQRPMLRTSLKPIAQLDQSGTLEVMTVGSKKSERVRTPIDYSQLNLTKNSKMLLDYSMSLRTPRKKKAEVPKLDLVKPTLHDGYFHPGMNQTEVDILLTGTRSLD
ncbi:hypothetical protein PCE1_003848 [Barthelona sp. PCE]